LSNFHQKKFLHGKKGLLKLGSHGEKIEQLLCIIPVKKIIPLKTIMHNLKTNKMSCPRKYHSSAAFNIY